MNTCIELVFFFFKRKTAYEMHISDWSAGVCSSDLLDTFTGSGSTGASVEGNVLTDGETTPGVDGAVGVDADEGGAGGLSHLASITIGGQTFTEIGCASCRTRECQYVSISVVGGSLQQK